MTHSLTCLMEITCGGAAGRAQIARVCSYCEREKNEGPFLQSYLKVMRVRKVSHGICREHYRAQMETLKLE